MPEANYFDSDSFSYTASDSRGGALAATVNITIHAANDSPTILSAPSDQVNQIGDTATLLTSACDPDTTQDALTYNAQNLLPGIALDSQSCLISGTFSADAAGTYAVVTTILDGALSDSVQFQWTVTAGALSICRLLVGNRRNG